MRAANNPFERKLRLALSLVCCRPRRAGNAGRIRHRAGLGGGGHGEDSNGLYTEELLQALRVPNLKVEEVFKRVRVGVTNRSKGAQTPWESSSLTGDLVVNVTVNVTTPATQPLTADREALFWASIKDGTDPAGFEAYLKQYPDGVLSRSPGSGSRAWSQSRPPRTPRASTEPGRSPSSVRRTTVRQASRCVPRRRSRTERSTGSTASPDSRTR